MSYYIKCEGLGFEYSRGETILDNVSLEVGKGEIFCLLGPSGCGKTTLLKLLIGLLSPSKGTVRRGDVSNAKLGLMPQDYCLHQYFTTREALSYYGLIAGNNAQENKVQAEAIIDFLDIKAQKNCMISTLSGGQKRRVSFGTALMGNPGFLVLDEPTVGTDPVLRESIWKCLRVLASSGRSILLTTHYVEEASNSDTIGFMREGRILETGTPANLFIKYQTRSIQHIFLKLCCQDEKLKNEENKLHTFEIEQGSNQQSLIYQKGQTSRDHQREREFVGKLFGTNKTDRDVRFPTKMTALLYKNLRVLYRHRMFMIFNAVLPLVSFLIFFFSIGRPLKDLRVGFVTENVKLSCPGYLSCNISDPSTVTCNLLEFMKDKTGLVLSEYPNETSAIQAVKDYKVKHVSKLILCN